ncbi:MAG: hypothetical protein C4K48_05325 [Candidatus Thorarchaeota archaeon]|nr:MAG: hypothetical protein C4K48_05325 [Candidatus Thorarchaeota archaeon]
MSDNDELREALELCGLVSRDRQESRLLNILNATLRIQIDTPRPPTFSEIHRQIEKDNPNTHLTKAWIHKVLKALIEVRMIRIDNPTTHRKGYIADVNTIMAGLEQLKSQRVKQLEDEMKRIQEHLARVSALDCGTLAQEFVKNETGKQQEISSRVVRGVEELHRVLRYNMLDVAKKGDIVRASMLWLGPFIDENAGNRTMSFVKAAERGADVRYLVTADALKLEEGVGLMPDTKSRLALIHFILELRKKGIEFDVRFYQGPKTYNQVSFNNDSMALVISENPLTATWITRQFNPDLIDNAVKSFDRDWKRAKSFFGLTPENAAALGMAPGGMISKLVNPKTREDEEKIQR